MIVNVQQMICYGNYKIWVMKYHICSFTNDPVQVVICEPDRLVNAAMANLAAFRTGTGWTRRMAVCPGRVR